MLYAFEHGEPGDLFVQKAPAATIETLAAGREAGLRAPTTRSQIIGTRHGEKLYETLLTREEMLRAEDLGDYYRVPADNRDLNYDAYFTEGIEPLSQQEDYNSHNTRRLDVDGDGRAAAEARLRPRASWRMAASSAALPVAEAQR